MPNIVEIIISAKSTTAGAWASEKAKAEKAGTEAGKSFSSGLHRTLNAATKIAAGTFVTGMIFAVNSGEKLEQSQLSLSRAIDKSKSSFDGMDGMLDGTRKTMEGLGYSNADVDASLAKLTASTGSVRTAISFEQIAADLAAKRHISLADATALLTRAGQGNAKSMKEMGITIATGSTWAKATASANQILKDRIKEAGGMALFAAGQHMSLSSAHKLVDAAAKGSIPALNKLGIDVLPKSATAVQRLGEFSRIMASKLKGEASAAAETSAGKFAILRAKFTDVAAALGEKLLPPLIRVLSYISDHSNTILRFVGVVGGLLIAVKVGEAIKGLALAFKGLALAMTANPWMLVAAAVIAAILLIIKYHNQIWAFIQRIWHDVYSFIKRIWDDILNFARQWWPLIFGPGGLIIKYHNTIFQFIMRIWNDILGFFRRIWGNIYGFFSSTLNNTKNLFINAWNNISNTARSVWNGLVGWFAGLPGRIYNALRSVLGMMSGLGRAIIQNIWNGAKSVVGGITGFFEGFAKGIVGVFKKIWGWFSPSAVMYQGGKSLMEGLAGGIKDHAGKAVTQASTVANNMVANVGSGVERWRGLVLRALAMEGLPSSLVGMILTQMQSESGGNPNAINLWDSNAAAGHPSKGLMQTIDSTFSAYHWPGTSWNVYDPLANIAAALNYAAHNRGFGSGPGQVGSGHGYGSGGIGSGWAMVGEYGRELVRLPTGSHVFPHGQSDGMMGGGGGGILRLEIMASGNSAFEQFMLAALRNWVVVRGGGNVQTAFGRR